MKKEKQYQTPEFVFIRQDESNKVFFAASGGFSSSAPATTYNVGSTSEW